MTVTLKITGSGIEKVDKTFIGSSVHNVLKQANDYFLYTGDPKLGSPPSKETGHERMGSAGTEPERDKSKEHVKEHEKKPHLKEEE